MLFNNTDKADTVFEILKDFDPYDTHSQNPFQRELKGLKDAGFDASKVFNPDIQDFDKQLCETFFIKKLDDKTIEIQINEAPYEFSKEFFECFMNPNIESFITVTLFGDGAEFSYYNGNEINFYNAEDIDDDAYDSFEKSIEEDTFVKVAKKLILDEKVPPMTDEY